MPKIEYISKNFGADRLELIDRINGVITDYSAQGYSLTLRQVYYQMVARAIIPNNERSYKNLGNLINDARLAGLIDWNAIEDRTRNLRGNSHWTTPGSMIDSAAYSYHLDHWKGQQNYVEVWVYGIQNPSEGMKAEIKLAQKIGIPVMDAAEVYQRATERRCWA